MKALLGLAFIPLDADLGLLLLRVSFAALMIVFHGWEKLLTARRQFHTFPNLIGIGSELSYVLVVWLEVFGAVLIALGLLTRLHALGLAFTLFIAWLLWHKRRFTGPNAGEMAFAYMFGYLLLFFTGAGRYSLDHLFGL
ncbi:MAG TPA: DoxX family protein [Polyangiaceae bacterium]|nr:DoxX family protein [Polyangiaceae bacterium]